MTEQTEQPAEGELTAPVPRRVEYAGPEGWSVWTDEDGTHLRSARGDCLEDREVAFLIGLWHDARVAAARGHIAAPRVPSREERRHDSDVRQAAHLRRRVGDAAVEALGLPTTTDRHPF